MTEPLDLFSMEPDVVDFPVPNHHATVDSDPTPKPVPKNMRERLQELKGSKDTRKPANTRTRASKPSVPNVPGQFLEPVEEFYNMMALVMMPFKPELSMAIMGPMRQMTAEEYANGGADIPTVAQNCARAWDAAAQKNETIRRMLNGFTTVSTLGMLASAHLPIILAAGGGNALDKVMRRGEQEPQEA